jgi:ornithine cyclodeaminase/alanine dehydrogenase-like protein (mu-crystallin family)
MRIVSASDVHRICQWSALVEALAEGHRQGVPLSGRAGVTASVRGTTQTFLNLPAVLPGVAFGSKLVTVLPDNPDRHPGVPAIQALYAVFGGDDGAPLAVIDGTSLTYRKTAGDSALGTQLLAREDAATLVMVGAGGLSLWLARAHMAMRPSLTRVLVWNRTAHRADAVAAELAADGIDAKSVTDLEAAVRQADIVSCCTAATQPLVQGAWLKAGTHVNLVGGYTPDMREVDDETVRRARLFVDADWNVEESGDLIDPIGRRVIDRGKIEADLYTLCRPGHDIARAPGDITLFKNGGGGHLDLYTALFILKSLQHPA